MNQPKALIPLSLTEMWERFGIYLVQGLLIFFMINTLNFTDAKAYAVMGQFTALIYISPLLGGFCADRMLGFRYSILLGAFMLFAGYLILTFSSFASVNQVIFSKENAMILGLTVVILGNGFLKPNISSFLGQFYGADDPRRDSGFTIYYMVFNTGIALSTLISGYIQMKFGWAVCFATASFGLILAIGFFLWGYRYFSNLGLPPQLEKSNYSRTGLIILVLIISAIACFALLKLTVGNLILAVAGIVILIYLTSITLKLETIDRKRMLALVVLVIVSIVFWSMFFQIFLVANVFIDRNVDRQIFGHIVPPVAFISMEPIFIFILSPIFSILWTRIYRTKKNVSRGLQFALALFITALAMQFLVIGIHFPNSQSLVNPMWIVISYFAITIAELLLSPIGLSMITQLAPKKYVGLMMGVWFLGLSYGGLLAGYLGQQATVKKELINHPEMSNFIYAHAFQNYALITLVAAVVTLILTPWLNRLVKSS